MAAKNKALILECALKLFNEQGSMHVTTNHLAEASNVSTGNLYYHFKNKEAIILALVQQMVERWNSGSSTLQSQPITPALMEKQLERVFETVWQYRFIHRELSPLLQAYPSVREYTVPVLQGRKTEINAILQAFDTAQIIKLENTEQREYLANMLLYIPLFWQNYLDTLGEKLNPSNIRQGIDMMRQLLIPYLV